MYQIPRQKAVDSRRWRCTKPHNLANPKQYISSLDQQPKPHTVRKQTKKSIYEICFMLGEPLLGCLILRRIQKNIEN